MSVLGDGPEVAPPDARRQLEQVMAEIEEEVRRRRLSGDLPLHVEKELDELFVRHAPVSGAGRGIDDVLAMVDRSTFVDPVVPIASQKSGGALVKRAVRQLTLWYVGFVSHQVSQFASATSRALHVIAEELDDLSDRLDAQRVVSPRIIQWQTHREDAWWVDLATEALGQTSGRVLHAAAGDGWLLGRLHAADIDAYGLEPRVLGDGEAGVAPKERTQGVAFDIRDESVVDHLRAVAPGTLGGLVLSGVVDGMSPGQRQQLVELSVDRLTEGGQLLVHSLSPTIWDSELAPPEADLCPGRPLRPRSWEQLLGELGLSARALDGPRGEDYLVIATVRDSGQRWQGRSMRDLRGGPIRDRSR